VAAVNSRPNVIFISAPDPNGAFEFESKTRSEGMHVTAENDANEPATEENYNDKRDDP
jgi:hypothetical protein